MKLISDSAIIMTKEMLSTILTQDAWQRGIIPPTCHLTVTHVDSFENELEIEVDVYQETMH